LRYREKPLEITGRPPGIFNIVGNEGAERFSYYGMRAILVTFMTKHLMDASGNPAPMSEEDAKVAYHLFATSVYFLPLLGAFLADVLFGKYRVIMALSIVYCVGHGVLALDDTRTGLMLGLTLIALGAGGIKPCVAAHVGDQFGTMNQGLRERIFSWFYMSINAGAFISMLLTPWVMHTYGPGPAFAIPGVAMMLATIVFWMGRNKFAHVPAGGMAFFKEVFTGTNLRTFARLALVLAFTSIFWALYDQSGSAWVLQAEHMDRHVLGFEIYSEQVQTVNPVMILILAPLFAYWVYPVAGRLLDSPLKKIWVGFLIIAGGFGLSAWIQMQIDAGLTPSIAWQVLGFLIITAAEVMVAITVLEFVYAAVPKNTKSFAMSLELLAVAAGNLVTAGVNWFIQNPDGTTKLTGAEYYLFFAALMLATAVLFLPLVVTYRKPYNRLAEPVV
jgi:POT family proton-dependent oligopeptide transporter